MTRRSFVATVPALGLTSQLAAWPQAIEHSAQRPVLQVDTVDSAAEAKERVAAVRRASGCMRAEVFAASDGRLALFQTWASESAATRFTAEGMELAPALIRLEV